MPVTGDAVWRGVQAPALRNSVRWRKVIGQRCLSSERGRQDKHVGVMTVGAPWPGSQGGLSRGSDIFPSGVQHGVPGCIVSPPAAPQFIRQGPHPLALQSAISSGHKFIADVVS